APSCAATAIDGSSPVLRHVPAWDQRYVWPVTTAIEHDKKPGNRLSHLFCKRIFAQYRTMDFLCALLMRCLSPVN
ncbi:hypothetical protein, partial [Erwinia amylovora]